MSWIDLDRLDADVNGDPQAMADAAAVLRGFALILDAEATAPTGRLRDRLTVRDGFGRTLPIGATHAQHD